MPKILIIGAGPCGLGAAWRLKERGFEDFLILEAGDQPGGLASSFTDEKGFTWDIGGHVQFSHYEDFDRVMDLALPNGWLHHQRESWVWIADRFVPYPFQNNIWRLPDEMRRDCLEGLRALGVNGLQTKPNNFGEWINASFGEGLARHFMRPYNFKVWAYAPEKMSYQWIGERVATVDLARVEENIRLKRDDVSWGPNATFRFPKKGGTGAIWNSVANLIGKEKMRFNTRVERIDSRAKTIVAGGTKFSYESVLTTIPIDRLFGLLGKEFPMQLLSSNSHIVGIGLKGTAPEALQTKCWMYFPENDCPFYRVTVFSNYSPANVPDPKKTWSLMCETSESPDKPVDTSNIIEQTIDGLIATKLIRSRDEVVSKWSYSAKPGYPTPTPDRDKILTRAFSELEAEKIFSRGRFGAWKYEVSNQDHTFMQGFEWADRYLTGREEQTVNYPSRVNAPGKRPLVLV